MVILNEFESQVTGGSYKGKVFLENGAPGSADLRKVAAIMKECTSQKFANFEDRSEEILQYGCIAGNKDLNVELAKFLSNVYRNPVLSEDLFTNTGATQGLTDILNWFFLPGDVIFISELTYMAIVNPLKESEFTIVPIGVDENGMKVDELEEKLEEFQGRLATKRYPYRAAVYTIPVIHNPTSAIMPEGRCKKLIKLARKHDLMIISDDAYNVLTYSAPDCRDPIAAKPPVRMFWQDCKDDADYKGSVISINSFSKFLAPGLRLGWFEMPKSAQESFSASYLSLSGSGRNPFTSGIITEGLKSGLIQKHVDYVRQLYAEKMRRAHEIFTTKLAKYGVTCDVPTGGMFLWVVLPDDVKADDVLKLSEHEISFLPGQRFSFSGSYTNCLRICTSYYEADVLYSAVSKLSDYITQAIEQANGRQTNWKPKVQLSDVAATPAIRQEDYKQLVLTGAN